MCKCTSIKIIELFEVERSHDDPETNDGKGSEENSRIESFFRTSFFVLGIFLFPLRSVNIEDPVLTVIHFSLHSFTLFCFLSVLARHPGQTGPRPFFPRAAGRVASRSAMNYLFANIHWEEHPRIPVNVFRFSTQSDLPSSFHPFPRAFARTKIGISWLLARWASGKKKTRRKAMRFLISPA